VLNWAESSRSGEVLVVVVVLAIAQEEEGEGEEAGLPWWGTGTNCVWLE
jgi:hypothetical protein